MLQATRDGLIPARTEQPVEGEVVEGPFCSLCPHLLAEHYRDTYACMVSSATEAWACSCPGTAER